jgi:hypothetical protein
MKKQTSLPTPPPRKTLRQLDAKTLAGVHGGQGVAVGWGVQLDDPATTP